jgi:hypothetical protein
MKTGVELIAQERHEQIEKHDRTIERDAKFNANGEMKAVARYILGVGTDSEYPRNWSSDWKFKLDRKTPVEKLVIAGAFIAAEIDRLAAASEIKLTKQDISAELFDTTYDDLTGMKKQLVDLLYRY